MIQLPAPQLLERFAVMVSDIQQRTAGLLAVADVAAASDLELAAARAARAQNLTRVATALRHAGALRTGLSVANATGTILALTSDATHRDLVGDQQWPVNRYRRWLTDTLQAALLEGGVALRDGGRDRRDSARGTSPIVATVLGIGPWAARRRFRGGAVVPG
jgi:hypothetical protein